MVANDGRSLADRFRAHYGHESHLYAHAMRGMADDWEAGGPVREICRGWEDSPPGAMVQLRLLAGVFRLVLRGEAPELVASYPCLGGDADPADAWPVMWEVMQRHVSQLHEALGVAPQTNEVGRSCALLVGLFEAVRRHGLARVRLLEPGASAGLNLLVDRYRFEGCGWSFGPAEAEVVLRGVGAEGARPEAFRMVGRRGCDLAPVDPRDPEAAVYLKSFVWPWMLERHARLDAALRVAAEHPVVVDRAPASAWLAEQLASAPPHGVLTVVWESVTRVYWAAEEVARVDEAVAGARGRMPLSHLRLEDSPRPERKLPDITLDETVLGHAGHHGTPVVLNAGRS